MIAGIPESTGPDMWVYVRVFGVAQWAIFVILLILMALALSLESILDMHGSDIELEQRAPLRDNRMKYVSSGLTLVALYTIQMGDQTSSKHITPRFLTLTIAMLTLLLWIYYNCDITAEMTSGAPDIGVRNFEDVLTGNYKVVTTSGHLESILRNAKPGSAKHRVYQTNYERTADWKTTMNEIVHNPKILYYQIALTLLPPAQSPEWKNVTDRAFALKMDDEIIRFNALGFQLNSEFIEISNYYILKSMEAGLMKRHYRNNHVALYTKEQFGMPEPGALSIDNVMFCFTCLAIGSCISVSMAIVERLRKIMEKFTRFLKGKGMVRRGQNKSDFQEIEITERAGDEGKQEERGKM